MNLILCMMKRDWLPISFHEEDAEDAERSGNVPVLLVDLLFYSYLVFFFPLTNKNDVSEE